MQHANSEKGEERVCGCSAEIYSCNTQTLRKGREKGWVGALQKCSAERSGECSVPRSRHQAPPSETDGEGLLQGKGAQRPLKRGLLQGKGAQRPM